MNVFGASKDPEAKIIIPESNRITGNIGIEYLIFGEIEYLF